MRAVPCSVLLVSILIAALPGSASASGWSAPETLSPAFTSYSTPPRVGAGVGFTAAWGDGDSLDAAARSGGTWSSSASVSTSSELAQSGRLATNAAGAAAAVWTGDANSQVKVAVRSAGSAWEPPVSVATAAPGQTLQIANPRVAVAPDGAVTVAWTAWDIITDSPLRVYARTRPAGGSWGTSDVVSTGLGAADDARMEDLAVDGDGTLFALWRREATGVADLQLAAREPAGAWGAPELVAGGAGSGAQVLALDGGALAVYRPQFGNGILSRVRTAGGWQDAQTVTDDDAWISSFHAAASGGSAVAAWHAGPSGAADEIRAAVRPAGGSWGGYETVADGEDFEGPRAAVDGDGDVVLAWVRRLLTQTNGTDFDWAAEARVRRASSGWSATATLSAPTATKHHAATPDVAVDAAGIATAVWTAREAGFSRQVTAATTTGALDTFDTGEPSCPGGSASPGGLDDAFGCGGIVMSPFPNGAAGVLGVAEQPDGRLVAAGFGDGEDRFGLARFSTAGDLDPSFDVDGRVTWRPLLGGHANDVLLQGDGRIVAVGSEDGYGFSVARFDADGAPDTSFDGDGVASLEMAGYTLPAANSGLVQPDGRIVVVGTGLEQSSGEWRFLLARFHADGALDQSFGTGGRVVTSFPAGARAYAVARQSDGRLVVAGGTVDGNFAVARYTTAGALDTSFDGDGRVVNDVGVPGGAAGRDVAIDSRGRIVVGGNVDNGTHVGLARYRPDGSQDTSFDVDGEATTQFEGAELIKDGGIAIDAQDRILIAASGGQDASSLRFLLARYNPTGALDPTFDGDGRVMTAPAFSARAKDVDVLAGGSIVVAGEATVAPGADPAFALVRYRGGGAAAAYPGDPAGGGSGSGGTTTTTHAQSGEPSPPDAQPRAENVCSTAERRPGESLTAGLLVNGRVVPAGASEWWIEYGKTTAYGAASPHRSISAPTTGGSPTWVGMTAVDLTGNHSFGPVKWHGLDYGTTYHFRVKIRRTAGGPTSPGPDCVFKTPDFFGGQPTPSHRGVEVPVDNPAAGALVIAEAFNCPPGMDELTCITSMQSRRRPLASASAARPRGSTLLGRTVIKRAKKGRLKLRVRYSAKGRKLARKLARTPRTRRAVLRVTIKPRRGAKLTRSMPFVLKR